ncbi:hypothetical protein L914_10791 [Phytophthora nicotianae]|uniref:Uncharacterized protein n=1 Tax=Phytophthora nicotianae TaxID=4792 RepID=W2N857_PHYNI|nr:hypothetical protein L914_10791 [Phytophthora nicotianae]
MKKVHHQHTGRSEPPKMLRLRIVQLQGDYSQGSTTV